MPVTLQDIQKEENGARFLSADLHIHSYGGSADVKDRAMTAGAIIEVAVAQGISLVAITDHNSDYSTQTSIQYAQKYAGQLLVLPGVEITTAHGHLLAYFPPESSGSVRDSLDEKRAGRRVLHEDYVPALWWPRFVSMHICNEPLTEANRGTHRSGGYFEGRKTRLARDVFEGWEKSSNKEDDGKGGIRKAGKRQGSLRLLQFRCCVGGFDRDEELPQDQDRSDHGRKDAEQARVVLQRVEEMRD